jgi:hypothetical protein
MQSLTILLPEMVYKNAAEEAAEHNVDVPSLCSGILSDYFFETKSEHPVKMESKKEVPLATEKFDVAASFADFPRESVRLAQQFVDAALKLPRVKAFRTNRGVGFEPNFVFLEYIKSRQIGIVVSFYGEPHRHKNPPTILHKSIPSYSRAKVSSQRELDQILPHIQQSHELKFGK